MQCKALRDSAREIQNFDVAYFMASVDTLEDNTAFAAEHEANFPIRADPRKEMVDAYGALMGVGFAKWAADALKSGAEWRIKTDFLPHVEAVFCACDTKSH